MSNRVERRQVIKIMIRNFFIWLVPVILILAVSVIVVLILMSAAADVGSSGGEKKDPFRKWPKGLIGSLGIGYTLVGILSLCSFFYFRDIDGEGIVYIIGLAVICFLFGFWGIKYDYKRLRGHLDPEKT